MRDGARPVDAARFDENVLRFAAMRAGVHAQSAADRAGNAAVEFEAGDPRLGRRVGEPDIRRRGAGREPMIADRLDRTERLAAEAEHDAGDAAVADDDIRGQADRRDGNLRRQPAQKIGEVVFIGRLVQSCAGPPTRNQL